MIGAGRLRHRVTFRRRDAVPDGYGNSVGALVDLVTVWGELMQARGRETLEAGRVGEVVAAVLTVRDSPEIRAILPSDTLHHAGVDWNIRSGPIPLLKERGFVEFALERGVAI